MSAAGAYVSRRAGGALPSTSPSKLDEASNKGGGDTTDASGAAVGVETSMIDLRVISRDSSSLIAADGDVDLKLRQRGGWRSCRV